MTVNEVKGGQRYVVRVRADEAFDHKGVVFYLHHEDDLPDQVYAQWIPAHRDRSDPYLRSAVEQTFDEDEVRQLRACLRHDNEQVLVEAVKCPVGEQ
jgi:hypothetical protein